MELVEIVDPVLELLRLGAAVDGVGEEVDVGVQRELVHGVDARQVVQREEQHRRSDRHRHVALARTR